jgi:hypothetical protein
MQEAITRTNKFFITTTLGSDVVAVEPTETMEESSSRSPRSDGAMTPPWQPIRTTQHALPPPPPMAMWILVADKQVHAYVDGKQLWWYDPTDCACGPLGAVELSVARQRWLRLQRPLVSDECVVQGRRCNSQ